MQPLSARFAAIATAASIASLASAAASALTVTLVPGFESFQTTRVQAIVENGSEIVDEDLPTSVPASGSVVATSGSLAEQLDYELSTTGFDFRSSLAAQPGVATAAYADIFFQVDEPTRYEASGSFAATNQAGTFVWLNADLNEYLGHVMISAQESDATANEAFVLGGLEGDSRNVMHGSLTGTLVPGRTYQFQIVMNVSEGSAPSTASGRVTLGLSPVPEPASTSLMLAGLAELAALAACRRAR